MDTFVKAHGERVSRDFTDVHGKSTFLWFCWCFLSIPFRYDQPPFRTACRKAARHKNLAAMKLPFANYH